MKKFAERIWIQDQDQKIFGVELGTRMTIVQLENNDLFVHSPVQLTEDIQAELESLGQVKYVIAPNKWHHLYVQGMLQSFSEAKAFCAPGLEKKRSDLQFDAVISNDQSFPWNSELLHLVVEGADLVGEIVFFHPRSKTLILTDLALHICQSQSVYTRFWLKLIGSYGKFGLSKLEKFVFIKNQTAFDRSISKVLSWDFDRILLAHGSPVETGGKAVFLKAFT